MGSRRRRSPGSSGGKRRQAGQTLQNVVTPRLRVARTAWQEGRHADALQLFEDAVRREPTNVRGYVDAARAYASRFDFQRMETLLDRLRQLAPRHAGVHHLAGETYALLKLTGRAIDCYQQACRCAGVLPETWVDLASFYERGHRLDDAAELIARAQRASPGIPMAQLVEAKIERRRGQSQRAEEILRALLAVADDGSEVARRDPQPARRGAQLLPSLLAAEPRQCPVLDFGADRRALCARYDRMAQVPPTANPHRLV